MKAENLKPIHGVPYPVNWDKETIPLYTADQFADALESAMQAVDAYHRCHFNDYSEKARPHQEWLAKIEELRKGS